MAANYASRHNDLFQYRSLPSTRRSVATLMTNGSTGQEEGTVIATTLAHFRNAITTVDEEPSCRMGR